MPISSPEQVDAKANESGHRNYSDDDDKCDDPYSNYNSRTLKQLYFVGYLTELKPEV